MPAMLLTTPFRLNTIVLPNRFVLTAMVTRLSGEDGHVNGPILDRYARYARGRPGLIVVEAMAVHGAKSGPLLRISDDSFLPGLSELVRRVHDASPSKVFPQIIHFLKIARSGWRQKVEDLALDEIGAIVEQYARAAERARRAGFDGVELHMAHAYTLSSFLSRMNGRRDAYGGSLENRLRLPTEVVLAVRRTVGNDFPVGVRFDAEECIRDGYGLMDAREIALRLSEAGVDYVSLSAGGKFEDAVHKEGEALYPYTGYSGDRTMPGATYQDGYNVYLAEGVKAHLRENGRPTAVITTGKIPTAKLGEEILQAGKADLIGMARALLADPDLPRKVEEGREETVVRCVYGNVCKSLDENFRQVLCVLWPKGAIDAPVSEDKIPPEWGEPSPLAARVEGGKVRLNWSAAKDNEAVYGYEVFRAVGTGPWAHVASVRGVVKTWFDTMATGGRGYRYQVRAYDLAGNRSAPSNDAEVRLPTVWEAQAVASEQTAEVRQCPSS